jgi:hypothetical protein
MSPAQAGLAGPGYAKRQKDKGRRPAFQENPRLASRRELYFP